MTAGTSAETPAAVTPGTAPGALMTALRAHHRGGPEQLVVEPAPRPVPGDGEVLVAVHACGITFAELDWDASWTRDGVDRTPVVPGHEVSGTVAERGPGALDLALGDEVFGLVPFDRDGGAATYVAVPQAALVPRPRTVPHAVAAAVPLSALTAWQALTDHVQVRPGESALVLGGAGGVGCFAVQLARDLGATVTATCRTRDVDLVRRLGARTVLDVDGDGHPADRSFDVVVDTVGGAAVDQAFAALRPGGRLVTLSAPPSQERARELGVRAGFFVVSADRPGLRQLAERVDDGRLQVQIAATFTLADGRAAYESGAVPGRPAGKTVLLVV